MLDTSIYVLPADHIDRRVVKTFLADQATQRLFLESSTLEFKRDNSNANVVKAICGMANAEGGLIFVGVDEKSPDHAPGVVPTMRDTIVDQCRSLLQPTIYPEIIPVPADEEEKVILVVRVAAAVHLQPVFCQGAVYVRTPGSTTKANRDHVISMVTASRSFAGPAKGQLALLLANTFAPHYSDLDRDGQSNVPELRLRAAGGLVVRGEAQSKLLLRRGLRERIENYIDNSFLATWATGRDPLTAPEWDIEDMRSDIWRQVRSLPRRWEPKPVVLAVEVKTGPQRVSWAVDVDILAPAKATVRDKTAPVLGVEAFLQGWSLLADLAGDGLAQIVSDALVAPPISSPEVMLWAVSGQHDMQKALGLDALYTAVPRGKQGTWQLDLPDADPTSVAASIRYWFERQLLDDGVWGAEEAAEEAVRRAAPRHVSAAW